MPTIYTLGPILGIDDQIDEGPCSATISYSDVQGGWTGTGNIDLDPLFENPIAGDYHLTIGSPCIDTGSPWEWTNDPDGTRADMGAYYFNQSTLASPENILIAIISGNVQISWDETPDATSYTVFSSNDPHLAFEYWTLEESGITETSWSNPIRGIQKFYRITASN